MLSKISKEDFLKYLNWIFIAIIACGVIYRLSIFFVARSLWLDEAMLAKCIVTRSIPEIAQGFLDYGQSSPFGYLLVTKIFTLIFGVNECALRLYSLLTGLGTLWLAYLLGRNTLKMKMPLMPVAVLSMIPILCLYSNELKPYMGDVFCTLSSIYLYDRYKAGKRSLWIVSLVYAVFVWMSFGCLFVMGGICVYHVFGQMVLAYKGKSTWSNSLVTIIPLSLVAISVLADYLLWVAPATKNVDSESNEYWRFLAFPIIPTSLTDIKTIVNMAKDIIEPVVGPKCILSPFFVLPFIYSVYVLRKEWYTISLLICTFVILVASSLGLFPITIRLQLFMFVIFMIYCCYAQVKFIANIAHNKATIAATILIIFCPMLWFPFNLINKPHYYNDNHELKHCMAYIDSEIKKETNACIYFPNIVRPMAEFYTDYKVNNPLGWKTTKIIEDGNQIWGTKFSIMNNSVAYKYHWDFDEAKTMENVKAIMKYDKAYIVDCHSEGMELPDAKKITRFKKLKALLSGGTQALNDMEKEQEVLQLQNSVFGHLLDALKKQGKVTLVYDFHKSRVFKFEKQNVSQSNSVK